MDKTTYFNDRAALIAEAEQAVQDNDLALSQEKRNAIAELDKQYEDYCKAQADIEAEKIKQAEMEAENARKQAEIAAQAKLNEPATNIEDKSAVIGEERIVDNMDTKLTDAATKELDAFKNYLAGKPFDAEALRFDDSANTKSGNAVVIPETVKESIWQEMADRHPVLASLRMTFVNGNLSILKEVAKGDAAAWYDETGDIADGALSFAKVELKGYELAKTVPVTWALKKMSIDALLPYITSLVAERMGAALANAVVNGLGIPGQSDTFKAQPKGIVTAIEAETNTPQEITYNSHIAFADLCNAMAKIKSGYYAGAKIYAKNATIWGELAQILDENGRPIFIPDCTAGGVGRIFGVPVFEEDAVADNAVLVSNLEETYVANCNENVTLYTEDKPTARTTYYMGYAIIDGQPITTLGSVYIKKSA